MRELLQPFLDHCVLIEKVSDFRKENMEMKSELRKSNTVINSLELGLNEKRN
jgi:hypothetical protein